MATRCSGSGGSRQTACVQALPSKIATAGLAQARGVDAKPLARLAYEIEHALENGVVARVVVVDLATRPGEAG
jgi:hypothetical protein